MSYEINHSELCKQIKADFDKYTLPPRFLYFRASGWKAPSRIRLSVHPHKSDKKLLKGLAARGLNPRVWTPAPKSEPSRFEQSTLYSLLCDLCKLFSNDWGRY